MRRTDSSLIIKIALIAVLVVFLVVIYRNSDAKDVPMDTIKEYMLENTALESSMTEQDETDLSQFVGLNYSSYDSFMYYRNEEALSVEEVLVVKTPEGGDLDAAVQDSVEERVSSQTTLYEGYGPEQVALLSDAIIITRGDYLFYCVSENAEEYEEAFLSTV